MPKTKSHSDKMSLEDYLLCIQSRSTLHLTVAHLNQIISMHGFKKIHRKNKKFLSEAVSTVDLVEPSRSTLGDYISPPVVNACLNDVVADMNALSWQECGITAINTLSAFQQNDAVEFSNNHRQSPPSAALDFYHGGVSGTTTTTAPVKKVVQRRKRRTQESSDAVAKRQTKRSGNNRGGGATSLALRCGSLDSYSS